MESESNFLMLLPAETQLDEWSTWYDGADEAFFQYISHVQALFPHNTDIQYVSDKPKAELYQLLQKRLAQSLPNNLNFKFANLPAEDIALLEKLTQVVGTPANLLPQVVHVMIEGGKQTELFTVLHDNAHSNITSLINEESNRRPEQDQITVVKGLVGSYPGAFWKLQRSQLPELVSAIEQLQNEQDYQRLMNEFGVRRTDPDFWPHSDKIHQLNHRAKPISGGLLDYNRLENR